MNLTNSFLDQKRKRLEIKNGVRLLTLIVVFLLSVGITGTMALAALSDDFPEIVEITIPPVPEASYYDHTASTNWYEETGQTNPVGSGTNNTWYPLDGRSPDTTGNKIKVDGTIQTTFRINYFCKCCRQRRSYCRWFSCSQLQ
jgi:hypothetical protein